MGNIAIGGSNPISVQSMTNTSNVDATIKQILELEKAGCEIVRIAVPDVQTATSLQKIKDNINIPIVADIHFDYRLAIASAPYVDKLRINPGNIGKDEFVEEVVESAKKYNIPIRIGINLGSLEKEIEQKYGRTAKALVESARYHINLLENYDFTNIIVSLKASDIKTTVEANQMFSKEFDYPLHIGITESGAYESGSIKSAIGIGILLNQGIGNTIRVSLSGDPVKEILVAKKILQHLGIRKDNSVTSCPTCARCTIDVEKFAKMIENNIQTDKKIAIMGCVVNGPGEAKDADIAIVGRNDELLLYVDGEFVETISEDNFLEKVRSRL